MATTSLGMYNPYYAAYGMGGTATLTAHGAGTITSLVGTLAQGMLAKKMGGYNAYLASINAIADERLANWQAEQATRAAQIADQDAEIAQQAAAFRERQLRLLRSRQQAENRLAYGGSGVALEGSPLMTLMDNQYQAEEEALLARYEGALAVRAQTLQGEQARLQADALRYQGQRALTVGRLQSDVSRYQAAAAQQASYLGAASTLTQGAGYVGGQYHLKQVMAGT